MGGCFSAWVTEMVEPLEETRGELVFATEPVLSSLELSIPGAGRSTPLVELDEVEVREHSSKSYADERLIQGHARFKKVYFRYAKGFHSCILRHS